MKLTDDKKTVEITMQEYKYGEWQEDWSEDFFEAGQLKYDASAEAYIVEDVDYCIGQANDWQQCIGDFAIEADYGASPDNRNVEVK